ncbi:regulator of chromosome condensation RCC1 [Monoraphidium neglectum]|uniref:Regulator of chromosome condensation RCC1 n=1 Tax=Monoraphidium neglectum TaxID=145388 RepID=A0A0D2MZH5_9CHLO|nr:regulator of chromosome condensation RCC1 [Monoraphidium neglectum]KIZ05682.1 regulator of chromosome condensation RCC1 [Monoraphidium neglectum]|eukprot:XP_013904701.1 regulator of chromosome condensation RCC1 [Monoraphidium neglectum]
MQSLTACCSRVTTTGAAGAALSCDPASGLVLAVSSNPNEDVDAKVSVAATSGNTLSFAGAGGAPSATCETPSRPLQWDALPTPLAPTSSGTAVLKISKPASGAACAAASCAGATPSAGAYLAVNQGHTCAVTQAGSVACSGFNQWGQLGGGSFSQANAPVNVGDSVANARAVVAGLRHSCALLSSGKVMCWGNNQYSQLGTTALTADQNTYKATPYAVDGLTNAIALSAGPYFTCAITSDGGLRCWGQNRAGEAAGQVTSDSIRRTPGASGLISIGDVIAVAAGGPLSATAGFTCVVVRGGQVKCIGSNGAGLVIDSSKPATEARQSWTDVAVKDAVDIAAGQAHVCALRVGGKVSCWGSSAAGQVGNGVQGSNVLAPVEVVGGGAVSVSAGTSHTAVLMSDGSVRTWGSNAYGQLGTGNQAARSTPGAATTLPTATAAVAGGDSTCVLTAAGARACVGRGEWGSAGDNAPKQSITSAVNAQGGPYRSVGATFVRVSASDGTNVCDLPLSVKIDYTCEPRCRLVIQQAADDSFVPVSFSLPVDIAGCVAAGVAAVAVASYVAVSVAGCVAVAQPDDDTPQPDAPQHHQREDGHLGECELVRIPFYTADDSMYTNLITKVEGSECLKGSFKAAVLIGPDSGPPKIGDKVYQERFAKVANTQEFTTFGYLHTGYGKRPLQEVLTQIDTWLDKEKGFGSQVQGIWVNQVPPAADTPELVAYFDAIIERIRFYSSLVSLNPGTDMTDCKLAAKADFVNSFENTFDTWKATSPSCTCAKSTRCIASIHSYTGPGQVADLAALMAETYKRGFQGTFITELKM